MNTFTDAGLYREWLAARHGAHLAYGTDLDTATIAWRHCRRLARLIGGTPETVARQAVADWLEAE